MSRSHESERFFVKGLPSWVFLREFGNSRIIRSSYVWIFFVPIVAKLSQELERTFNAKNGGYQLVFQLPFSWQMFYFSAVSFAIAAAIFSLRCPFLIRRFGTPIEFMNDGRGVKELLDYCERTSQSLPDLQKELLDNVIGNAHQRLRSQGWKQGAAAREHGVYLEADRSERREVIQSLFYSATGVLKDLRPFSRLACTTAFFLGFCFFGAVLVENFYFVVLAFNERIG